MKSKKILLISTILILVSLFLSACSGAVTASTSWHGVTADDTLAYLAAGTQVYGVDLSTGAQKWKFPADKPNPKGFYATPVFADDNSQLLIPGYDGSLNSVNPTNGALIWKFSGSAYKLIASPLVLDNIIYQPSTDGIVYALDLQGNMVRSFDISSDALWAQPATAAGCSCIYISAMDHSVYAINLTSGEQIWKTDDLGGSVIGRPAVGTDGTLYVGTFGSEMVALDGTNGSVLWRFSTEDKVWGGPALDNNVLYFGDLSGYLYAVNAGDGTQVWRNQPNKAIVEAPLVSGDTLYLTTETPSLFTISTAGEIVNTTVVGGDYIYTTPVIAGDKILVTPVNYDKNLLVALSLESPNAPAKWLFVPAK
jgi:outer membrane protein assembly factor BamB